MSAREPSTRPSASVTRSLAGSKDAAAPRTHSAPAGISPASSRRVASAAKMPPPTIVRSEEHTSELQSLMRISYAVFCLNKHTNNHDLKHQHNGLRTETCKPQQVATTTPHS